MDTKRGARQLNQDVLGIVLVNKEDGKDDLQHKKLLEMLVKSTSISSKDLEVLLKAMDNLDVIAKVFLLEGVPFVFANSPMKYLVFRQQVADRFEIGYQDVCIVGSAKLGFSPSPYKFGRPFSETSDVDVVIISSELFDQGTHSLFRHLHNLGPPLNYENKQPVNVDAINWKTHKEAIRNFVYENFNPSHLPEGDQIRTRIFSNISSTAGLFLALEPQVFVSKIRCRVFRHWRAAEAYYINTLRQLKRHLVPGVNSQSSDIDEEDVIGTET